MARESLSASPWVCQSELPWAFQLASPWVFQSALRGVNAAVVGLLLAALYDPVWTSAVTDAADVLLAAACFGLLYQKTPAWAVVVLAAGAGAALAAV